MTTELLVRKEPLPAHILESLNMTPTATCVELKAGDELYGLVCAHLVKSGTARSFTMSIGNSRGCCDSDDEDECNEEHEQSRVAKKEIGLGLFTFEYEGKSIHALHHTLGDVVGTNCGPALMKGLALIVDSSKAEGDADVVSISSADSSSSERDIDVITRFCNQLIATADATSDKTFSIYRWHVQYQYWRKVEVSKARSVESVVLPSELKAKIVDDIAEFASTSTKSWYTEHGVPYKRSYLLHGSPGAGKTSLIQALAGKFKRNVCFMSSLSHPEMNDDNLKSAVQRVPAKSILVLEDIDALFSNGRTKRDGDKSALTFSGVLNALDGVGASSGQIFIMTTNHREHLDPALIRNGRVDTHIEFSDATPEQMKMLFVQFYKGASDKLAAQFADGLCELLGEHTVSMAALQHYFTMMRRKPAEVAAVEVQKILDEAAAHGMKLAKKGEAGKHKAEEGKEEEKEEEKEEKEEEEEKGKAKKNKAKASGGGGGKEVHVHVHVD